MGMLRELCKLEKLSRNSKLVTENDEIKIYRESVAITNSTHATETLLVNILRKGEYNGRH